MYEIVAPNGKVHLPPEGNCWKVVQSEYERALAEGRVTFGSDGNYNLHFNYFKPF